MLFLANCPQSHIASPGKKAHGKNILADGPMRCGFQPPNCLQYTPAYDFSYMLSVKKSKEAFVACGYKVKKKMF